MANYSFVNGGIVAERMGIGIAWGRKYGGAREKFQIREILFSIRNVILLNSSLDISAFLIGSYYRILKSFDI